MRWNDIAAAEVNEKNKERNSRWSERWIKRYDT